MKYNQLVTIAKARFSKCGIETPQLDAELLLTDLLSSDRTFLILHGDDESLLEQEEEYFERVARRESGIPLQYITGKQEFMGLQFAVNETVLIPRQDTEVLVETAIEKARTLSGNGSLDILDMCTGSGAIALSLSHYLPEARITAADISEKALGTAKKNARQLGLYERVDFVSGDMFESVRGKKFDLILCNPPYIRTDILSTLQTEVKDHEPMSALDGGADGLGFYRIIAKDAPGYITDGGWIMLEIGHDQGETVSKLLLDAGCFSNISVLKDLAGNNRIVIAKKR